MGSKRKLVKYLIPIITAKRKKNQFYVEPFAGGMNMISKVDGNRIANDISTPLIEMWRALVIDHWTPPQYIEEELYLEIKNNQEKYSKHLVGWAGHICSFRGMLFGGFAGKIITAKGISRNYQTESIRNIRSQIPSMSDVIFKNEEYYNLEIPSNSIIYCDPPYENTSGYSVEFDHEKFWQWVREKTIEGHLVYVSEFSAPDDFICIFDKQFTSNLSVTGNGHGGRKIMDEKLFILNGYQEQHLIQLF